MKKALPTGTIAAVLLTISSPASAAVTIAVDGDPVLYWNQVMLSVLSGSPTVGGRNIAMFNIALHDAVNFSLGAPNKSWLPGYIGGVGDVRAATSYAAHDMLAALYPASLSVIDAALISSLSYVPDGAAKVTGSATGAAVAASVLAARSTDGASAPSTYVPTGAPGHWSPTPPAFAPAGLPQYATLDPFLMASPDVFRAPPPPAIDSPEYAAYLEEVAAIGSSGSLIRSSDQTAAAIFWSALPANGAGPWIQATIDASYAAGFDTLANAGILAQLSVAVGDTGIAVWDTKYAYDLWRPVTAIQHADLDGNPLTLADPTWSSLIGAPAHPSYVSAHAAVAGAASTVLNSRLGNAIPFCLTIASNNRCWDSFDAAALDAANSRLWGGIHYRFDNEAGLALGTSVGRSTLDSATFSAVPEPATWLMLLAGFGAVGTSLRRTRRTMPAPA